MPWQLAEEIYHEDLCEDLGRTDCSRAPALGTLLVKGRLGLTDRETVDAIQENPYLQFFIGLEEFTLDRPFDATLMVDFRKRFGEEGIQRISEAIALAALEQSAVEDSTDNDPDPPVDNTYPAASDRMALVNPPPIKDN